MLFSKTRANLKGALASAVAVSEALKGSAFRLGETASKQDLVITRMNQMIERFERLARMHEEILQMARTRESLLDSLLIEKAKEARAVTAKTEAESRSREEAEESKYDRLF